MKAFLWALLILLSLNLQAKTFSLMTYNLENLFDIEHDKGKEDWTYLPLSFKQTSGAVKAYCETLLNEYYRKTCFEYDWDEKALQGKLKNIAKVIKSFDQGRGADIIVFQEIENMKVLKRLVNDELKYMGYRYGSLIEGPDVRGIDVALISRFPVVSRQYYPIDLSPYSQRETRGILKSILKIGEKSVSVLANHWPSQANVSETRLKASQVLLGIAERSRTDIVIATGDFNTKKDDNPHGIKQNILPNFIDVQVQGRKASGEKAPGTHWYYGEWTFLDRIFVYKKSLKHFKVKYETYDVVAYPFMLRDLWWTDRDTGERVLSKNIPAKFYNKTLKGVSDHLPVGIKFEL